LIEQMARADEALGALFRAHVAQVRGFVRSRVVQDDDVEDIIAATFRTAFARLGEIPTAAELAWLFSVARNHVHNHIRSERRRALIIDAIVANRSGDRSSTLAELSNADDESPLLAALSSLSDTEREVLELAAWHGMEPHEIAKVMGMTPNAARVRLHRARQRLIDLCQTDTTATEGLCHD
jgi:RNA polymerase sigma-70 factor (ECF subfamily)